MREIREIIFWKNRLEAREIIREIIFWRRRLERTRREIEREREREREIYCLI